MSIELKQAAQQAAEAIDWMLNVIRRDAPQISGKAMGNAEKCATGLRTAIQQAEAQQPATGEPVAWSERDQLRHAQAAVVMPMIGPLLDAWENSDREVMSQEPELSKQLKNINSAMEDADIHLATGEPDDVARDAERYRWLRDNGVLGFSGAPSWRVSVSFDAMDAYAQTLDSNIDATMIAASPAQKGGE